MSTLKKNYSKTRFYTTYTIRFQLTVFIYLIFFTDRINIHIFVCDHQLGTIINLYDCIHRLRSEYEYNYSASRCNALHKYEKYKHNIILYKYKIIYIGIMYKKRSTTSKHDPSDPTVRFKTYTYGLRIIRALCDVLNVYYYCNRRPYRCFG